MSSEEPDAREDVRDGTGVHGADDEDTTLRSHRPASFAEPVDINAADEEELERIPALDAEHARAILRYRDEHGPLTSWRELDEIPGLDATTAERVREVGTLGDEERASRR